MSGHPPSATPNAVPTVADQAQDLYDIDYLTGLPSRWKGRDPTSIAENVLETLRDMLDLDVIGFRFTDTAHVFLRTGKSFGDTHEPDAILRVIEPWLECDPAHWPAVLSFGANDLRIAALPISDISSMGLLIVGSRRADFPRQPETLKLRIAGTQASLAFREVRELSDRPRPADTRAEKPTGEDLAESEWRLNLIINTIPAMVWSATPDGILDFSNQNLLDFVGLTAEEFLGFGFYDSFHPDDTPHLLAAWQQTMASKRPQDVEGRMRHANGDYRWFMLRQNPLLDADGNVIKWYGAIFDIEDRKRAEDTLKSTESALLASEYNLNLLINSLPVLAWSARPDGGAEFVNQSWVDYAGVPAEKILEWGFLEFYHPDDIPGMVAIWKRDLETSDRTFLKGRIRRADGEYRWFYFSGRKLTDANGVVRWFGVNVDIEDLQRSEDALRASEAALRESERRLQHIIKTVPGLIWSGDADGSVTYLSQQYLDYTGLTFEEALGGWTRSIHPEDLELLTNVWQTNLATGRGGSHEARLRRADGQYRWCLFISNPFFDNAGKLTEWFGINIDIHDRKRTEESLRQSQSDLAHVTRVMTTGELAVSIAHEVNQPLMAIVTNAGTCLRWLEDARLDVAQARQAAERIVRDGHRAGDIIAGIRALARKSPARMEPMDLQAAIQDVLELLKGELRRRGVTLDFKTTQDPVMVLGDRTQLQQVVLNLVMNSAEAMAEIMPDGRNVGVRITAKAEGGAQVSVSDNGPGVGPEIIERMFDAFFSTKPDGIGMGLAICLSIVEAHGGRIWASDNRPQGSILSFTVPLTEGGH